MIIELLAVSIPSLLLGAGIMKLALKSKKVERIVDRSEKKKYEAMNDPDFLLEKLNSNGVMVDDGDEVSFAVEEKDGKKQLIQNIKKNAATPGVPKFETKKVVKKKVVKKVVKKTPKKKIKKVVKKDSKK